MGSDLQRRIKVLYLLHDSRRSGVPAVAAHLIGTAGGIGVEPTVLFAYNGVYAEELRSGGIPVMALGERTPLVWRTKRFLLNVVLAAIGRKFDIVHIHSIKLAWSVLVARRLGLKVVFHLHELPKKIGPLLLKAMGEADCVVYCSKTCSDHFAAVPVRKSRIIVNSAAFPSSPPVRHEGVGASIVMAASLNRNKGQDLLLRAFSSLRNREARLWLYGTTGLSAHGFVRSLKVFAEENGVGDRVFFPGPTEDVYRVFSEASIVVHTSWTESFGMALVEAMSCGVPVIAHDLEGMREVVVDGVTGFLVKPGDVDELAARIDELLENPALRERMGLAGYRMVRERFNIDSRMNEYKELYEEISRR